VDSIVFEAPDIRRQPDSDLFAPQTAPKSELPEDSQSAASRAGDRSRWHWLLAVAVLIPLLTPLYNRAQPRLFGLPFFYWSQMAFVGLAAATTTLVYLVTKKRGS
jgi:hypothetical protein